jgi:hypothetical protein
MFYPVSTDVIHELRNDFTICTFNRDFANPAFLFAQLNRIRQELINDYKLTSYEDTDVLQHIMYNTKSAMYKMILGINQARLSNKTVQHAADNTYAFTVTWESSMLHPRGPQPVLCLATSLPKKRFPKKLKKDCSLCGKQGHKSVDCFSCPEN